MKNQNKSRRVPKDPQILHQKQYHDVLYCHLQAISVPAFNIDDIEFRYVPKKEMKYVKLAAAVGLTRQTVSTRIKNLQSIGLIFIEPSTGDCMITGLELKQTFTLPLETIKYLVSVYNDHTIDTYIYLLNRYFANGEKPFDFTINRLKANCGLSTKTESNNYIIHNILDALVKSKLIKLSVFMRPSDEGKAHKYEVWHRLEWVTKEYKPEILYTNNQQDCVDKS